jgi:hypothetical protein
MPQTIIDLDKAAPEDIGVKLEGEIYALPGDIAIPRLLKIERLMSQLDGSEDAGEGDTPFLELYEEVLELFRLRQPDLEELDMGARQLGALVVRLYTVAAEEDEKEERPTKASTRSTSRSKRSRGSKS